MVWCKMSGKKKAIPFIIGLCLTLAFIGCVRQNRYLPANYTKEEVKDLYRLNPELFHELVTTIASNKAFFEEGRVSQYSDADIISPYDAAMVYFSEAEKKIIEAVFETKPYMILYDYACRFVKVTYINEDNSSGYSLLFWTASKNENEQEFNEYIKHLKSLYKYEVELIDYYCILITPKR